jgi:chromosome segregation protein
LYIERLHLKGFKSFGASQDLVFSPGLTAIVGPNGSGKSNLLDALRWVLGDGGFQRLRIVRQGDLLFSGSASIPPATRAEVALFIRQDGTPGAGSCVLKRSFSPETGAVITVDGVRTRLADLDAVKRLWKLEGDQFAFIGQGEVAEAISQRPAQRRAHLELLFGIDQYRRKRNETSAKLVSAEEESLRLGALAAELSNRREEIAPAVALASRAKAITDTLEEKRRLYYFYRRRVLEESLAILEEEIRTLGAEETFRIRWRDRWEQMYSRSLRERGELEERVKCLRGDREELIRKREELRRSCFAAAAAVREIRSRTASLEGEEKSLSVRLGEIGAENGEILSKENSLSAELAAATGERDRLRGRMNQLRAAIEKEQERKKSLSAALSALGGEKETLRSKRESREAFLADCDARIKASREALAALREESAALEEKITDLERREAEVLEAHGDAFAACRKTASALQKARKEAASLDAAAEDLKTAESSSYPEPVRFLSSAYRLGKLQVPVTVAAESFSCPPSVTSALEAYLGGRQYWLFVKTIAEAGACIDLLKERRAGRATFLPLEKSRPRFPDRRAILPARGIVGWALEIVTPSEEWKPCVSHILGDLLLVEEYSVGAQLASRGASYPIASLEGEVFLPSGTVSGGRTRAAAGAIERRRRIREAEEHLARVRQEAASLAAALEKEEALERARSAEKEALTMELRETGKRLEEKRRDLDLEREACERLERDRRRALADAASWEQRMAEIDGEMEILFASMPSPSGGDEESSLPARLAEAENTCVLLQERLSSVASLRIRAASELERTRERLAYLAAERENCLAREQVEKERLERWGREQYLLFREIRDKEAALHALLDKEKLLASRSGRISVRSRRAVEAAGAAGERARTLASKRESLAGELRQLTEMWEEQYPYSSAEAPPGDEGEAASAAVRRLERELRALGEVEWGALSEDQSLSARVAFLSEQLGDVQAAIGELRGIISETDRHVGALFGKALENINARFNSLFCRLFGGGEARLRLQGPEPVGSGEEEESSPAWDAGVEIVARPPGKHLQNLAQLSGGEQTLTAIAYLFASMEVAGVPLAVLDEVDAALDESNLLRFGDLAKEYSSPPGQGKGIQLLVMTHRRATMERADILYGVTLAEPGLSRVVGMKVEDWAEPEEREGGRLSGAVRR